MTYEHPSIAPRRRVGPRSAFLSAALLIAAAGCNDSPVAPEDIRRPTTLVVESPVTIFESLEETASPAVTVLDQHGEVISDPTLAWSVGTQGVVEIAGPGVLRSIGNGEAQVTVRVEGAHPSVESSSALEATHRVVVDQRPIGLAFEGAGLGPDGELEVDWIGEPLDLTAQLVDANGHPLQEGGAEIEWDLGDSGILSWSEDGQIIATGNGTTTVRVVAGDWSAVLPVDVHAGADLEWCVGYRVPRPDAPPEGFEACDRTELTFGREGGD